MVATEQPTKCGALVVRRVAIVVVDDVWSDGISGAGATRNPCLGALVAGKYLLLPVAASVVHRVRHAGGGAV